MQEHILDEGIKVEADIHYGNFKQEAEDQKIFDLIFEEISNYKKELKNLKHVQVESHNMVRGINI